MIAVDVLNWSDLKYFLAVAREGSLARAAACLNVTHSTVFRRINALEEAVGVKLFMRLPDGYRLTSTGQDILRYVEDMADRINDIQRVLDNRNDQLSGTINITAPHNLAYRFLPGYVAEFQRSYPDICINTLVTNADCNLSRQEADLAIRATPSPPEYLIGHRLFSLQWGAYASPAYVERFGAPSNADELVEHRLIGAHEGLTHLPAFEWLARNIPQPGIVACCNDLVTMSAMAEAGVGITLLPDDNAKPELVRLFTFEHAANSQIWVLIHPDMRDCVRLKVFKDFIIRSFEEDEVFQRYGRNGVNVD